MSSKDQGSYLPIKEKDLAQYTKKADDLLKSVKWRAVGSVAPPEKGDSKAFRRAAVKPVEDIVKILDASKIISEDNILLKDSINHVLWVVKNGIRIGQYISAMYFKHSNLETLQQQKNRGGLIGDQKTQYYDKTTTNSAIAAFATAYYIVWELSQYQTDKVDGHNLEFRGIPELSLSSPVYATNCMVYYYGAYIQKSGLVRNDLDFVKMTLMYFQGIIDEVKNRKDALKHMEAFTEKAYKLVDSDFTLDGFDSTLLTGITSEVFNRVEFESIVGNKDARHATHRLIERLLCYDPVTRRNPMKELGALPPVRMGFGPPGTGKSMIIAAIATVLHDRCKWIGIPFLFRPMPENIISTFQGGSAERAIEWMKPLRDPDKIIYAPADDAENNFEERTRQGVAAGVREVIGVFLRNTEGASAINYGQWVIDLYTNIQEQIDKAVMSRIQSRFFIGGAMNEEDFLDQDHLWWKEIKEIDPDFVKMVDPEGYKYMEAQQRVESMSKLCGDLKEPAENVIREIFEVAMRKHSTDEHMFFAHFYTLIQKKFPLFTSRDVRNIQKSVSERILDFDLETEWLNEPEKFYLLDYDTKKDMIIELMKANMKGLSFADIRLQESIKYLDNMVKIALAGERRELDETARKLITQRKALVRADEMMKKPE